MSLYLNILCTVLVSCGIKISTVHAVFGFVTKHACDRQTDARTGGQNYDSQDLAGIAASRDKNLLKPCDTAKNTT